MTARFLLLALLLWTPAAWADRPAASPARVKRLKTQVVKKPPVLRVVHRLPKDVKAIEHPAVRAAKIGRTTVLFVDVDGGGRFDDQGIDGWTLGVMPARARVHYVFPLGDKLVLGADEIQVRVASDGTSVDVTSLRTKLSPTERVGLARLNLLRVRNAWPPLPVDAVRSLACAKHVHYMTIHDAYAHEEVEGRAGWSKEGAYAGIHSVIDLQVTLAEAFERWFATLYHRWPLTDPRLTAVGVATGGGYAMCSPLVDKRDDRWVWPVLVPAPESEGQPTRAGKELPMPYPAGEVAGYPITLQFPEWRSRVSEVRAVLRKKGASGPEVPCRLSWPGVPANPARERNDGTICLIPKRPLAARTSYWVRVSYTWREKPEQRTWTFRTGADRGPPEGGSR